MSDNKSMSLFSGGRVAAKPDAKELLQRMAGSASLDPRGAAADGAEYLNFSGKRGMYELGVDKEDIDPAELWLVNCHSFADGWVCWKGGRPAAKRMASIYDSPVSEPDPEELGPFSGQGEGWQQAKSFMLRSLETGVQALFSSNSKSGVSSFAGLQKEIANKMAETEENQYPIITMDKESFVSQGNKNYKPKFTIAGWVDEPTLHSTLEEHGEDMTAALAALSELVEERSAKRRPRRAMRREE